MLQISETVRHFNRINKRQSLYHIFRYAMIVASSQIIWKGLMVATCCELPIVIILSDVMGPAFHRGDLLFLTNYKRDPVCVGEIVVFKVEGRDIPIIHRVIKLHKEEDGSVKFLTKGDNNNVDDRGLYAPGQLWLTKKDIVGHVRGYLPYLGKIKIVLDQYPKCCIFFLMMILALLRLHKTL